MSLYQLLCSRLNLVQLTHIFYKHPFLRYVYIPLQKAADQALQQQAKTEPKNWLEPLQVEDWGYRRKARLGVRFVAKKDATHKNYLLIKMRNASPFVRKRFNF
jgi:hypothetical protein